MGDFLQTDLADGLTKPVRVPGVEVVDVREVVARPIVQLVLEVLEVKGGVEDELVVDGERTLLQGHGDGRGDESKLDKHLLVHGCK